MGKTRPIHFTHGEPVILSVWLLRTSKSNAVVSQVVTEKTDQLRLGNQTDEHQDSLIMAWDGFLSERTRKIVHRRIHS